MFGAFLEHDDCSQNEKAPGQENREAQDDGPEVADFGTVVLHLFLSWEVFAVGQNSHSDEAKHNSNHSISVNVWPPHNIVEEGGEGNRSAPNGVYNRHWQVFLGEARDSQKGDVPNGC